jgi:hypothetical protein
MTIAYLAVTVLFALMTAFSAVMKIRRDPNVVKIIHEVVGVPMKYFPLLTACEIAGAAGLILGIWFPPLGVAAGVGLVLYFVGAVASHLRVRDFKGIGPAAFMLAMSAAALALRIVTARS